MYCTKCGTKSNGGNFCVKCGHKINDSFQQKIVKIPRISKSDIQLSQDISPSSNSVVTNKNKSINKPKVVENEKITQQPVKRNIENQNTNVTPQAIQTPQVNNPVAIPLQDINLTNQEITTPQNTNNQTFQQPVIQMANEENIGANVQVPNANLEPQTIQMPIANVQTNQAVIPEQNTNINSEKINSVITNQSLVDDDYEINENELFSAYISKNVSKFKNGGFSWCTFFFGYIYMFYRKMWLLGIVYFVLSLILSVQPILNLILSIYISIIFKKIYSKHSMTKVKKIVLQHPQVSQKDLQYICYKKGGTANWVIVVFVVIPMIILGISILLITLPLINSTKNSSNKEIITESWNYSVAANIWQLSEYTKDNKSNTKCVKISTLKNKNLIKSSKYKGYIEFGDDINPNNNKVYITDGSKGIKGKSIKEINDKNITKVKTIKIPSYCK